MVLSTINQDPLIPSVPQFLQPVLNLIEKGQITETVHNDLDKEHVEDGGIEIELQGDHVNPDCALFNRALKQMSDNPACFIKEMPGKGIGMVARRKLYPGDLILSEKPALMMPQKVFDSSRDETEEWLDRAINRLNCEHRELFMALTDCTNPLDPNYLGRFYTNCMVYDTDYTVVCPVMARANHSCRPNAEFVDRADLGVNELRTMYVIEAGQEICINYLPMAEEACDVRDVRREYLRKFYGFHCVCRACTLEDKELAEEENLRESIKELQALGVESLSPEEVVVLLDGLYTIQGKLSYIHFVFETSYHDSQDQVQKMGYSMKGLSLAISLFGKTSEQALVWTERVSQLCRLQLWAECCLRYR